MIREMFLLAAGAILGFLAGAIAGIMATATTFMWEAHDVQVYTEPKNAPVQSERTMDLEEMR